MCGSRNDDRPLAGVPTPHHLRRFSYVHNGRLFRFDENTSGIPYRGVNKRTALTLTGPAPKRRELEDIDDGASPATPTQTAGDESPWLDDEVIGATQPTLLSPNASPRDADSGASDRSVSPVNPPPSARAYPPYSLISESEGEEDAENRLPSVESIQNAIPNLNLFGLGTPLQPAASNIAIDDPTKPHMHLLGEHFASLPAAVHKYTMYGLLRMCSRSTLSLLFNELESVLRRDILSSLPPELPKMVLKYLDLKSVVNASLVCRRWYSLIDGDLELWRTLLDTEKLHFQPSDLQLARVERWGYHGWSTLFQRGEAPRNAFGMPVNPYKAIFRRLDIIRQNWMNPEVSPRRRVIRCPNKEVITCLDFSEDLIIASTDDKRHLNVYDTQTGKLLHEFTNHDGGVWALKRVGKDIIVSGSIDHTVRVWSLSKKRCTHVFRGHSATVRCLDVVDPDPESGRDYPVILSGSRDTTVRMWRLPTSEDEDYDSRHAISDTDNPYLLGELRGHLDSVRTVCGAGNLACTGSYDYRVRVWEIAARRCRHELQGHDHRVYSVVMDQKRNRCISASMDNNIKIWDLDTGAELYNLTGHSGLVGLLRLENDLLVSGAADCSLRVWNPENGELINTLKGHDSAILCFDHDGQKIVSGSLRDLKLWDAQQGTFARDLLKEVEHIWQVSFNRQSCVVALARGQESFLEILDFDFDPATEQNNRITELGP